MLLEMMMGIGIEHSQKSRIGFYFSRANELSLFMIDEISASCSLAHSVDFLRPLALGPKELR